MFSATKFVVAGAIVALFSGLLLAGILTTPQPAEVVPAAVTESPSPMTTEESLSGFVTEEVEPGVFRVTNDGVRDLPSKHNVGIATGPDGVVWVLRAQRFFRLGEEGTGAWAVKRPRVVTRMTSSVMSRWMSLSPTAIFTTAVCGGFWKG